MTSAPRDPVRTSRIGLGLAALGRPAYLTLDHGADLAGDRSVDALRAHTHVMLDAAWSSGIRYLDAARSYGLAEEFLGSWLAAHPGRREQLTIGSKWGYTYVGDWRPDAAVHEVKDHSLATFTRQWPQTLAALGGPPDVHLVHSVTPDSPALTDRSLLDALADLAADGVRVGLSTSGPSQAETVRAALTLGASGPFRAVQATWNVLEPSAGAALAEAHEAGWFVVVKEAVANGRLTGRGDVPAFTDLAERAGAAPDALAIASALANPWAAVVLSGASTPDQLDSNLRALATPAPGDLAGLAQSPQDYWARRARLAWT